MTANEKRIDAIVTYTITIAMMCLVAGFTLAGIGVISL